MCSSDCQNYENCKTKIITKVHYNPGLRFISNICLNSLWGHFGMRQDFKQSEYSHN